jgi:hypothetical protein
MTTHVICTYHCLSCGRVEHTEPKEIVPQCCGQAMVMACKNAVPETEGDELPPVRGIYSCGRSER